MRLFRSDSIILYIHACTRAVRSVESVPYSISNFLQRSNFLRIFFTIMNFNVFNKNIISSPNVPNRAGVQVVGVHGNTPDGLLITLFDGETERQSKDE